MLILWVHSMKRMWWDGHLSHRQFLLKSGWGWVLGVPCPGPVVSPIPCDSPAVLSLGRALLLPLPEA